MQNLITIATYRQSKTAYFLKEHLENNGIDCFLGFLSDAGQETHGIMIRVKGEDVEEAIRIMMDLKEQFGADIENMEPSGHFRKIIVPTDFSEGSENACHYAVHLAQILKAEIKVLHVYEHPVDDAKVKYSATFEDYVGKVLAETEEKATKDIAAFTRRIREYMNAHAITDVKVHSSIIMGGIIDRIKEVSSEYKPDVIVLGTVGRMEESRSVLAGVTNEIIKGLEIPVYAIPGPCNIRDFEKINILYATDFNEKDHSSLDKLLKIVGDFNKNITCIHIDTAQNPSKQERMEELNAFLKEGYSQHEIVCRLIEDEDVYHGMKTFAEQNNFNLLSFTTKKRGIFEKLFKPNLFRKILQESNLPILIFPS